MEVRTSKGLTLWPDRGYDYDLPEHREQVRLWKTNEATPVLVEMQELTAEVGIATE